MTLYTRCSRRFSDRRITLDQLVPVSPHAASMEPTKLGLVPGTRITVQQAILGIVTKSANDAASALAELLGGDEDRFSQMMTLRARALGMTHTEYHNASGLPNPNQWTTAHDLAILARHLVQDYPVEYRFFKTTSFRFNGRTIMGHDNLLVSYPGADGIKTGYTDASGFNLVTSAVHSNVRLIGVVIGAAHAGERDQHMAYLLDQGFDQMDVPSTSTLVARRDTPSFSLIPAAHAATLAPMVPRAARWSVQVGAFGKEAAAQHAADVAQRLAGSGDAAVERATVARKVVWRAQVTGLTDAEARGTCASLAKHRQACTPVRAEAGQIASRWREAADPNAGHARTLALPGTAALACASCVDIISLEPPAFSGGGRSSAHGRRSRRTADHDSHQRGFRRHAGRRQTGGRSAGHGHRPCQTRRVHRAARPDLPRLHDRP